MQKINLYKSIVFLYTSNKHIDSGIRKYNIIYNCSKKCIGVNLTKHVQNFYAENYTTLMKEIFKSLIK